MVLLTRIYTKGGDKGKTSLGTGERLFKHALRIEVIGEVDEANAFIGKACFSLLKLGEEGQTGAKKLQKIQQDLFDVGADLCVPDKVSIEKLKISNRQVERLEKELDGMNENLLPLTSFILPGGSEASSDLHIARCVVRRVERKLCALLEKEALNPSLLQYLNRLSDYLFVMARYFNQKGKGDILWIPGKNQTP